MTLTPAQEKLLEELKVAPIHVGCGASIRRGRARPMNALIDAGLVVREMVDYGREGYRLKGKWDRYSVAK